MFKKALVMFSVMLLGLSLLPMFATAAADLDQPYMTIQGDQIVSSDIFEMSDDGTTLMAVDGYNNWVGVYSTDTGVKIWELAPGDVNLDDWFKAVLSGDGSHIVTADQFGLVSYYDLDVENESVWSDNASQKVYSLSISNDGIKVAVGMTGGIIFYDASGTKTTHPSGIYTFNVAISGNGNRTLAVAGDQLLFFNSTNVLKKTVTLPTTGLQVWLSDDGLTGAVSMSDGTVRFMRFYGQTMPNSQVFDHVFGTTYPSVDISRDGSTALVSSDEGIYLYDIGLSSVRWSISTDYGFDNGKLSGDGSIVAMPCYSIGQLRIYDGWTGELKESTHIYDVSFVEVSNDGNTVAALAYTIFVFRPGLDLVADPDAWTVTSDHTTGFWLEVKDGDVPVEGATIDLTTPGLVSTITITDKGDGLYWIQLSPGTISDTSSYTWQAVASLTGHVNGTASGTLTVIGTNDPQNTDEQIQDMKGDLNDTQAQLHDANDKIDDMNADLNDTQDELQDANGKIDSMQTMQFVLLGIVVVLGVVVIILLLRRGRA